MDNKTEKQENSNEQHLQLLGSIFKARQIPFLPTNSTACGILWDFCYGVRVYIPHNLEKQYLLTIVDIDNDIKLFEGVLNPDDYFVSEKKYFVNYGIQLVEHPSGKRMLQHKYNANGKDVLIRCPVQTLGDTLAWFNAISLFQRKHECNIYVRIADYIKPILKPAYPEMHFVNDEEMLNISPYASYTLAIFHEDYNKNETPVDYRTVPLHHYSSYILGVKTSDSPPIVACGKKLIEQPQEPYVVIASQASGGVKMWNNPLGWDEVVKFLKNSGYRVIDIDRDYAVGTGIYWNKIPREAEDLTGNFPLLDRVSMIAGADFFIGLGSGLSWLAWCCRVPIVLISGFSESWAEMPTDFRVINRNVCHGCFNDVRYRFNSEDYMWCPQHKGTARHWECSRAITAKSVIETIKKMPIFHEHIENYKNKTEQKENTR